MARRIVSRTVDRAQKLRRKGSAGMTTNTSSSGMGGGPPSDAASDTRTTHDSSQESPRPRFDVFHPIASLRAFALFKDHQLAAYETALDHERERREHALQVGTEEEKYRVEQSRILHDTHQEKRARQALTADGAKAAIDDLDGSLMVTAYADQMLSHDVQAIKDEALKTRQQQHIYRVHQRILTRIEAATTLLDFDPDEFLPEEQ